MKALRLLAAVVLLAAFAVPAQAVKTRHVRGFFLDSARPGLQLPAEYNIDVLPNALTTTYGIGAAPAATLAAGVAVTEYGFGFVHQTVFTLTAVSITVTDATTSGAHGVLKLYDFPAGLINPLGVTSDLAVTAGAGGIADAAVALCSVGTATVGTNNATLTTTEGDFIPSTSATLTAGVGDCDGEMTTALIALHDGTATAKDAFFSFVVPDGDSSANDTIAVTGTITLTWISSGDN